VEWVRGKWAVEVITSDGVKWANKLFTRETVEHREPAISPSANARK
jgi:hypothetical protein